MNINGTEHREDAMSILKRLARAVEHDAETALPDTLALALLSVVVMALFSIA
jgi:hypothetical protein